MGLTMTECLKKKENNQAKIRGDHVDQYRGGYLLLTHVLTQLDQLNKTN